ncbi:hypothetical protein A3F64_00370 [Candidatus Saccharibacteria bacterium RIFCSPHIGHO2_12_FULL_42_8]|nr:MAG: hypothetical protein A3F64_00370 [Candidatus Saccharibacteria bacterium RIFCSPHIGHO2_12_FULL_42_8]
MIISNPVPLRDVKHHAGSKFKKLRSNKIVSISCYTLIFGLIVGLAYTGRDSDSLVLAEKQDQQVTTSVTDDKPSIDQVAEANLAANLASQADLPIANNVNNQAISISAKSQLAQTSDETISKPQIIASNVSASKAFTTYKTIPGDTTPSIAAKFSLNPNTIKWANGLAGDAVEPGRDLLIPPVDGVVYSAQAGDTADSIAQKFHGDAQRVVLYNDLESSSAVAPGTQIIIPGGSPIIAVASPGSSSRSSSGSSTIATGIYASLSGGNRYDFGYCTWYAFNRRAALGRPVGGMWGNASSWASLARASGFLVNNRAAVGAVIQTANAAGGYGHVGVVESVNPDGSILISEMNYAGWNVKSTRTIGADSVGSYNYIH